ncbi:HD-GYP domain-containing protein [Leeia sp. TBRC 13508]|uniref:HD-GYP domain-containing protein n=1 Tax=Leeia speluncae TaxID=2884804 RepID=A0ABS8D4N4_9NEIS|nr:HD-GYP domain-containing protein [Leeia speluncae]MCB6182598.1 HD-GYP domain-containing protein [Leeia speluncae]
MIKKIQFDQLTPGMFVHDLNCDWMSHPFARNQFMVRSDEDLQKIANAGIHDLYIDTSKGLDVENAPTKAEVDAQLEAELEAIGSQRPEIVRISIAEELAKAKKIHSQAAQIVQDVMKDVRLGHAINVENVAPLVEDITGSVMRNNGALISLLKIKNKDDYTFLHSVSVCTLMVTFCHALQMDTDITREAGVGGLLHDLGKMKVPDSILNKPGKLTDEEFAIIRQHPMDGYNILVATPGVGNIPLDITRHHHERMDGSGYPDKLPGDQISTLSQMAAIVDVYDAITADRCYHKGMPPTEALKKMWEWSKFHFNPQLMQLFMRTVGIYPVGTLVRLESGKIGVVTEQSEKNMLTPKVKVMFSTKSNTFITPHEVDLSKPLGMGGGDKIVSHEDPLKWQIVPERYLA